MAANFWKFGAISEPNRRVHEVNTVSIENKLDQLTNIVNSLVIGKSHSFKACGICTMTDHPIDYCPSLHEENAYAVGTFPGPPQMPYNTYSNAYNSGWQDQPNFSYAHNPWPNSTYQPYQQPQKSALESMMENFITSQEQYQNRSESRFQELEKQMSQLAQSMSCLESRGTVIEQQSQEEHDTKNSTSVNEASDANSQEEGDATPQKRNSTPEPEQSPYAVQPHFPSKFIKEDKQAEEKEILDVFRKVEINILLLEVIRKMSRYARFLKEPCANARKLSEHEKVSLGENVYVVLTQRLPPKLKDQGMFAIPRRIHKISLKEVLSWTKRKKWRKLLCM
ncbi:hypothetical protein V6N13_024067 [Hibiscus sabdariffa]